MDIEFSINLITILEIASFISVLIILYYINKTIKKRRLQEFKTKKEAIEKSFKELIFGKDEDD